MLHVVNGHAESAVQGNNVCLYLGGGFRIRYTVHSGDECVVQVGNEVEIKLCMLMGAEQLMRCGIGRRELMVVRCNCTTQ